MSQAFRSVVLRLIEADILESERRADQSRLLEEFRYAADGTPLILNKNRSRVVLKGCAVPFGSVSEKIKGHYEKFRRGALTWDNGCALKVGHFGPEVANTANGRLRVWEDEDGLKFSALIADTQAGRVAVNSARFATGVSIRFQVAKRAYNGAVIEVRKARLKHIAILEAPSKPTYPLSSVFVNSELPP